MHLMRLQVIFYGPLPVEDLLIQGLQLLKVLFIGVPDILALAGQLVLISMLLLFHLIKKQV